MVKLITKRVNLQIYFLIGLSTDVVIVLAYVSRSISSLQINTSRHPFAYCLNITYDVPYFITYYPIIQKEQCHYNLAVLKTGVSLEKNLSLVKKCGVDLKLI
jgi:uncharacterized protein YpmS